MATYTPNYNLSKPENTDTNASFISAYRDNMDIIDANLGGSSIWIGTQSEYSSQSSSILDGTLVTITDDETDIVEAEQEEF